MSKDTGGPAFPSGAIRKSRRDPGADFFVTDQAEPKNEGLSLRDYFAAKAMHGMIANSFLVEHKAKHSMHELFETIKASASEAYAIADAMLEERNK